MKRFFVIALVVVFAVVIMTVPAFAAGGFIYDMGDISGADQPLESGTYTGRVYVDIPCAGLDYAWYDLEPFELEAWTELPEYGFAGTAYFVADGKRFTLDFSFYNEFGYMQREYLQVAECSDSDVEILELIPYSPPPATGDGAVASVFAVFTGIGGWLVTELGNVTTLFYQADSGLTVLGVLAVSGVGIAVVFCLINWIKSLLQFRK